ncbi:MerR family transcriptional regulator [Flavobacterium sp. GCM10023249]|uniref:MerR family transcriptional regulator n=1 Tax=unclassified Flavobacterium TaxID=196869 RepID=UPI00360771D9
MNNIKSIFSIKDLENLSGIKAHTIRIWEKRYGILQPMRTETNIRLYDAQNLQKLLNVVLLHNHGYKISKIANYSDEEIPTIARGIISEKSIHHHAISEFKLAMMNFNQFQFVKTYEELIKEKPFYQIFEEIFIPLLNEIGLLWQSETISPAHEHFISHLIRQKIILHTEKAQLETNIKNDKAYILYLPQNEIHEIGLLYLNYELIRHGCHTIYLGESIPTDNLQDVQKYFDNIVFVSYWTTQPSPDTIEEYIDNLKKEILTYGNSEYWILGRLATYVKKEYITQNIKVFNSIKEVLRQLNN